MVDAVIELHPVESPEQRLAARELVTEYLHWTAEYARSNYGLSFDLAEMFESDFNDPSKFFPPTGRFYLVRHGGDYAGIGALKRLGPGLCEVQRMYIRPHVRGVGAARVLLKRLLEDAEAIGYTTVRLESLKGLAAAHNLYRSAGFRDIGPYAEISMKGYQAPDDLSRYVGSAVFMELALSGVADKT